MAVDTGKSEHNVAVTIGQEAPSLSFVSSLMVTNGEEKKKQTRQQQKTHKTNPLGVTRLHGN